MQQHSLSRRAPAYGLVMALLGLGFSVTTITPATAATSRTTPFGALVDFPSEVLPTIAAIIDETAEGALALGLIQPPTDHPQDATQSEALMALIGRRIPPR